MTSVLEIYRALPADQRAAYDPAGKVGAPQVRRLQDLAKRLARLADAKRQARENPQFPAYRLDAAMSHVWGWRDNQKRRGINLAGPTERKPRPVYCLPLGGADYALAQNLSHDTHPRRHNWDGPDGSTSARREGDCIVRAFEYRGAHEGRVGHTYAPTMRALARISQDGAILCALIGYTNGTERPETAYTVQAGRGYRWGVDTNGVRLVRLADGADYHPDTDEIRAGRSVIVSALRERAATRIAAAKTAKREAAILKRACAGGVWVCLTDSIAAGNCRAGTESFARRHGLDVGRHYRADAIPAPSGPDESRRVALAVLAAQRRQARELAAGACEVRV